MKKAAILGPICLLATACGPSGEPEEGAEKQETRDEKSSSATAPSIFYVHCIGRDVHLRNYQPSISLSFEVDELQPGNLKQLEPVFKNYNAVCKNGDLKCNISVTTTEISVASIKRLTDIVQQSQTLNIDRTLGKFSGTQSMTINGAETTSYVATGQCEKSTSPTPTSAI